MKLLMITRKIDKDDPQAGFAYSWVEKTGEQVDQLKAICLEKGNTKDLPENIEVFSLGKENGKNKLKEFINFQKGAFKYIRQVDGVFCHMNPIYTILIAPYAKLFGKRMASWYSHKQISWQLRLMTFLTDFVLTPASDGFRLNSRKKRVVGHGINTDLFKPGQKKESSQLRLLAVGRISPIKNYETLIEAARFLKEKGIDFVLNIVGEPGLESQKKYFQELKKIVQEKDLEKEVVFLGGVAQYDLVKMYQEADLSINLCPTGSPDKVVLESMACACPALVCNRAFEKDFGPYTEKLIFEEKKSVDLGEKIINLKEEDLDKIGDFLRKKIVENHNLDKLISKIVNVFKKNS